MTASIDKLKTTPEQNTEIANHFAEVFSTGNVNNGHLYRNRYLLFELWTEKLSR
jgi:hypothetical protein